jgi:hypothetical protein
VNALAGEGVQVNRHGGSQRLPLAGLHLSDLALMQHDAPHHLHIEGAHF